MEALAVSTNSNALDVARRAAADHSALQVVFADYAERRADNTLRRLRIDLATFATT